MLKCLRTNCVQASQKHQLVLKQFKINYKYLFYQATLCWPIYVAGRRKQLLFNRSAIHTFHLYLKRPHILAYGFEWNDTTAASHVLGTPSPSCSYSALHGPPTYMWNFPKSDLHPPVNHLRDVPPTASAIRTQPPRAPTAQGPGLSRLPWPLLLAAAVACRSCFPQPPPAPDGDSFQKTLPGHGSADSAWPPPVLSITTRPRHLTVSCKPERETFTLSTSPSEGRFHSTVPWASDCYKVYCNTCQFTQPTPLQGMDKCHQGSRDGRVVYLAAMLQVPGTPHWTASRPSCWVWLAGPHGSFYSM